MSATPGGDRATRPFAAGAFEFTVVTDHADDRVIVETLFGDLAMPTGSGAERAVYSLRRTGSGTVGWAVNGPRVNESVRTLETALVSLVAAVNLSALDVEPECLHLHAGAATHQGRTVIIAAPRNTGKTTTIAHLVARGWGFVTDETVRLSPASTDVRGFPKPLSIKPGGRELVAHLEPWMIPPAGDEADAFRFVPMGATGATLADGGPPHLAILLRRPAGGASTTGPVARRLYPADAVVALMEETLDAERFGAAALQLARLAAACHCYELTIGTPAETVDAIEQLFRLDPAEALDVSVLPSSKAFAPGIVSVAVGDRAVVHDSVSGLIFALDTGAARVWAQLGGWNVGEHIDVDAPAIGPFIEQLRALGVLAGAA